jgi:hypothetical protein
MEDIGGQRAYSNCLLTVVVLIITRSNVNIFLMRVASPNKSRYILSHALLSPHFAIALHRQSAGGADAARRALNNTPLKNQSRRLC